MTRPRLALLVLVAASAVPTMAFAAEENPPAPGFNAEASDPRAVEIADEVMAAMGGREAWDATRYLAWNFFGMRSHVWDKWTGDARFEPEDRVVLFNVHRPEEGRVFAQGEEVTDEAERAKWLDNAYKAWINDSYWLLMPYKLKDTGVTLNYMGEGELPDGREADVVQLTFEDVGVTPQNKYHVLVSLDRRLVEEWAFFPTRETEEPQFRTPWADWREYGAILLSGDRGQRKIEDIHVFDELPRSVFESPEPVSFD